jgi:hypothetical protein
MATLEEKIVALDKEIAEYREDLKYAKENRNDQMILSTQALLTAKSYELTELRKQQQQQQQQQQLFAQQQQLFAQQQQLQQQQQTSQSL